MTREQAQKIVKNANSVREIIHTADGYKCPSCERVWHGKQGFIVAAIRKHIFWKCAPFTDEENGAQMALYGFMESDTEPCEIKGGW